MRLFYFLKKTIMTIAELKEKIADLPDDMKVGGAGHFGEFLDVLDADVREVDKDNRYFNAEKIVIFCIQIEYAGDEPD